MTRERVRNFSRDGTVFAQTNTPPAITSATTFTVDESTTMVAPLTATDDNPAAADLIWSQPGGAVTRRDNQNKARGVWMRADAGWRWLGAVVAVGAVLVWADCLYAQSSGNPPEPVGRSIKALLAQKAQRTPAQRKVSSQLLDAAERARPSDDDARDERGVIEASSAKGQVADLFTPADVSPPLSLSSDDLTLRSRMVTMDLGQVQATVAAPPGQPPQTRDTSVPTPGTTLTLNLFDDVVVTGMVEQTAPTFSGGYSVAGRIVDEPLGSMTLVVNGETVAGTVRLLDGTYYIHSAGDGLYAISEVEEPPLDCGVEEPHSETDHDH